jgi:hypothetical protein
MRIVISHNERSDSLHDAQEPGMCFHLARPDIKRRRHHSHRIFILNIIGFLGIRSLSTRFLSFCFESHPTQPSTDMVNRRSRRKTFRIRIPKTPRQIAIALLRLVKLALLGYCAVAVIWITVFWLWPGRVISVTAVKGTPDNGGLRLGKVKPQLNGWSGIRYNGVRWE